MISQQFYLEEAEGFGHKSKYKSFTAFGWSVVGGQGTTSLGHPKRVLHLAPSLQNVLM